MKALLASALTALVLVGAAWSANVTPGQLTALTKRVAALEKSNAQLTSYVNGCLRHFQPVSQFGQSTPTEGYQYVYPDGSTGVTTALDIPDATTKETPDYWFVSAPSSCVPAK